MTLGASRREGTRTPGGVSVDDGELPRRAVEVRGWRRAHITTNNPPLLPPWQHNLAPHGMAQEFVK